MRYPQRLQPAILLRRYKRFLADVRLDSGEEITVHCANTGAMTHCAEPGSRVWLLDSQNSARKYRFSWEWTTIAGRWRACINTARANQLVAEALENRCLPALDQWQELQREPRVEDGRLDFCLHEADGRKVWVEVKSVTLVRAASLATDGAPVVCFPDAVTSRGRKHLQRLQALVAAGDRAVLLFCVAVDDVGAVEAAADIDPDYADALQEAVAAGVEVICARVRFTSDASGDHMWLEATQGLFRQP
ncbi:DNA/RNA nuclease SfsA [Parathalassolituus penaei]|uniref:Sugar fermentation stimulation protein homolog n=1 Tax=Parathalassolituus penaei TaxID=2997323 RepID=A0A9X3EC00_9GAMM|nr:DNA/RNA nuclease SfsA [Parathalassolituus penaei]MCY0964380.1 DNA/RNA nuclease SfsA [Parathalassolituus penaei]